MAAVDVRKSLVEALQLDLIGPATGLGSPDEVLPQRPSSWYLTGFILPIDVDDDQGVDQESGEELDQQSDAKGLDDATAVDPPSAKLPHLPASIGLSLLVGKDTKSLKVVVLWGDYKQQKPEDGKGGGSEWKRTDRREEMTVVLPEKLTGPKEKVVPGSGGPGGSLCLAISVRPVTGVKTEGAIPAGTRAVSVFLVNRRKPEPDETRDQAYAFQAGLEISTEGPLVARPNLRSMESEDRDERVADLQYHDACEYAVGHSVSVEATMEGSTCRRVRTCWLPVAEVERVAAAEITGVELSMDKLADLASGDAAKEQLGKLVTAYQAWIEAQKAAIPTKPAKRKATAVDLLERAHKASLRIEEGIKLLGDEKCLEAFKIANRAMAAQARQRFGVMKGIDPKTIQPAWRPFQLAFILMNLKGIVDPTDTDRRVVDLLFFPTGGGKTEAYLGLAAFTLVLRRLSNPGITSAGLSVLMRYTLRLLTLDQLGRAATLICALELERQSNVDKLGEWPFEIGLWVGQAATPNFMGQKGDGNSDSARARTIAYKNDDSKPSPIPIEECPWCGERLKAASFNLLPNPDYPTDLRVSCVSRKCQFGGRNPLPVLSVDEPIYRRLPCFMIATVDKFAAMPWTGPVGGFFGRVDRYDKRAGFYGPCELSVGNAIPGGSLPPPDLVIQDELHLISGPLGTMVGLYECALDELCAREVDGQKIRPKIIASTATVRRAENQIRALFNRRLVDIFPPPGPDRRDSFFAKTQPKAESHARMYVGVAAQGRSPKKIMLRTYLALLGAAQKAYLVQGKKPDPNNPADPYMTLLGYFNSLRELGSARRIVEDEVSNSLIGYSKRRRVGEADGVFADRKIAYDVLELTSRVSTNKVAEAKRRLQLTFSEKDHTDVAIATNMISVGLDITRLGLMVVYGQPKTSAEYIQATSRVGRDEKKPGLVVTMLNIHKPRDRSHYERFAAYHESFYRSVEATSVTPFSPRALDRGLAGTMVALARHGLAAMTPATGAGAIMSQRSHLNFVVEDLGDRAKSVIDKPAVDAEALRQAVRNRTLDLLDEWNKIAHELSQNGAALQYQSEVGAAKRLLHEFLNTELKTLPPKYKMFRANRSLRDVEPNVNLWLKKLDGVDVEEDEV